MTPSGLWVAACGPFALRDPARTRNPRCGKTRCVRVKHRAVARKTCHCGSSVLRLLTQASLPAPSVDHCVVWCALPKLFFVRVCCRIVFHEFFVFFPNQVLDVSCMFPHFTVLLIKRLQQANGIASIETKSHPPDPCLTFAKGGKFFAFMSTRPCQCPPLGGFCPSRGMSLKTMTLASLSLLLDSTFATHTGIIPACPVT